MTDGATPKTDLIEDLANIEHQRWSDWQRWVHDSGDTHSGLAVDEPVYIEAGDTILRANRVEHWNRLIATPYADLPEHSKQADRDQVMRYWPLIVEFVGMWIENEDNAGLTIDELAQVWREEMA